MKGGMGTSRLTNKLLLRIPGLLGSVLVLMATIELKDAGSTIAGNLEWLGLQPPQFIQVDIADTWVTVLGIILILLWAVLVWMTREKKPEPNTLTIIEQLERKRAEREAFIRELDRPIKSMFVVFSLNEEVVASDLSDVAGMLMVVRQHDQCLYFGACGSGDGCGLWTEVWTYPCSPTKDDTPQWIDKFKLSGFNRLNRLEAGAQMLTPFTAFGELGDAIVIIRATPRLIHFLSKVSLVVNGYVVFERTASEIVDWHIPPKIPPGTRFDIDVRDAWAERLRDFQLGVALMKGDTHPSPQEMRSTIDLSETPRRISLNLPNAKRVADGTTVHVSCSLPENERGRLPPV